MIRAKLSAKSARLGWRAATAALLLSTCLAGPVLAEETTAATPATAETTTAPAAPALEMKVDIPTVDVTEGNITADEVREIFTNLSNEGAARLATITAKRISIPTLAVSFTMPVEGAEPVNSASTMYDIVFEDVVDGVAARATVSKADSGSPMLGLTYGAMTVNNLNLGAMLGIYGFSADADESSEPKQIYSSFKIDGGSLKADAVNCTLGVIEGGQFSARPFSVSFADLSEAITAAEAADKAGEKPSAETIETIVAYYVDIFSAFSSDPFVFKGFDCSGTDPQSGNAVKVASGDITIDGFQPGIYPAFGINGVKVDLGALGRFDLGNFTWKKMDLTGPIETLQSAENFDEEWFAANWRALIPAIEGLSLFGLDMDVADPEKPGERVKLKVGGFDATLGDYFNGIPSNISVSTDNLVIPVNPADPSMANLAQMGLSQVDVSFGTAFHWNEDSSTIAVDKLTFDSPELGRIGISGTLGNATADLFSEDNEAAMMASMGLTVQQVHITLEDRGIAANMIAAGAKEAGQPEATFRTMVSGQMQGMLLAILGSNEQAMGAAKAIGEFINGKKQIDLTLTSVDPAGVSLAEITAASENPTLLSGKFTVEGTAQ